MGTIGARPKLGFGFLGFQCPKIAEVMGVSLSTIRRTMYVYRMSEFGLSVTALYSSITDNELDEIVSQIKHDFPNTNSLQNCCSGNVNIQ